jgi:acyl carrier protein
VGASDRLFQRGTPQATRRGRVWSQALSRDGSLALVLAAVHARRVVARYDSVLRLARARRLVDVGSGSSLALVDYHDLRETLDHSHPDLTGSPAGEGGSISVVLSSKLLGRLPRDLWTASYRWMLENVGSFWPDESCAAPPPDGCGEQSPPNGIDDGGRMTKLDPYQIVEETLRGPCGVKTMITAESRLMEDLHLDSMGMLALAVGLENRFRIRLDEDPEQPPVTVDDVVHLLRKQLKGTEDG